MSNKRALLSNKRPLSTNNAALLPKAISAEKNKNKGHPHIPVFVCLIGKIN